MPTLRDIQTAMLDDIFKGTERSASYLKPLPGMEARLKIYIDNTTLGLTDILANAYPVVQRLVGDDFFTVLSQAYLRAHPQPSGNRHDFGAELSAFLNDYEPAESLPYLPDIAALEWALFSAMLSPDAPVMTFDALQDQIQQKEDLVMVLHPSVRLLSLDYDVLSIWGAHQEEKVGKITLIEKPQELLVWRDQQDTEQIQAGSPPFMRFLKACSEGLSLEAAMIQGFESDEENGKNQNLQHQNLQREFASAINNGIFQGGIDD